MFLVYLSIFTINYPSIWTYIELWLPTHLQLKFQGNHYVGEQQNHRETRVGYRETKLLGNILDVDVAKEKLQMCSSIGTIAAVADMTVTLFRGKFSTHDHAYALVLFEFCHVALTWSLSWAPIQLSSTQEGSPTTSWCTSATSSHHCDASISVWIRNGHLSTLWGSLWFCWHQSVSICISSVSMSWWEDQVSGVLIAHFLATDWIDHPPPRIDRYTQSIFCMCMST